MRRALLCAALVSAGVATAMPAAATASASRGGAPAPARDTTALFVAGGTQLTNAFFFPGTIVCLGTNNCYGSDLPLQVPQGNDIELNNLDADLAAGSHGIVCFKFIRRRGRPACALAPFPGPGQRVMITSNLKPGIYKYTCQVHSGMLGSFEIVGN